MRITIQGGMFSIDDDEIAYSNIRNMYINGSRHGLQLSERLQHKQSEIINLCAGIADNIYSLQDILKEKDND